MKKRNRLLAEIFRLQNQRSRLEYLLRRAADKKTMLRIEAQLETIRTSLRGCWHL